MFESFLENLYKTENLLDVGKDGRATQSSLSKWSKENDAQRALSGEKFSDFAFHTNKEQNPWWQIEWEDPQLIKYLIINNRKDRVCATRAIPLKITVTNNSNQAIVIYNGQLLFGSLPESMPLILPLNYHYLVKKIRIEIQGNDYMHLCNILCLRKKSMQEERGKLIFFANRDDGLGERLRALLNAMYHADKYDGEFLFGWQEFQRSHISMNKDIFDVNFLRKYFLDKPDIDSKLNIIPIKDVKKIDFEHLKQYDVIQVEQHHHHHYPNFWNKTFFNDKISKIKDDVFALDFKNNVAAIHLRTADIVYGNWRHTEVFYYKVQPIYMVEDLIQVLKNQGYEIILISLERDLTKFLAEKYNILSADNFLKNDYNDLEMAFFEMFLMSRCSKILTSGSGFAMLPSSIAGVPLESYHNYLSKDSLIHSFNKFLSKDGLFFNKNVSKRLKAFTISHFLNDFFDDIDLSQKVKLVELMMMMDNDNVYYRLMQSIIYYEDGQYEVSDKILIKELIDNSGHFNVLIKEFFWRKNTTLSRHIASFDKASKNGSIVATIMVLINDFYFHKKVDVGHYQSIIEQTRIKNPNALGLDLLEQKLNEFTKNRNFL